MQKSTSEKIRETFYRLGQTKTADDISFSLLAKEANISRTTLYSYYSNKEVLLDDLQRRMIAPIMEIIRKAKMFHPGSDAVAALTDLILYCRNNGDKIHLLRYASDSSFLDKIYTRLRRQLEFDLAEMHIPFTKVQSYFIISTLLNLMIPSPLYLADVPVEEVAREYKNAADRILGISKNS